MGRPVGGGTRLLECALDAAHTRAHLVFPVVPRGKMPAFAGWQQQATRDTEVITAWWQARPYNLGLLTGETSRLLVVDLDSSHGVTPSPRWAGARHGRDVLAQLAAEAGESMPTDTYTVATPSGGLHLYFRQPEGSPPLRNTAGRLGPWIDTRGSGGFVVAAGSVRRAGRYRTVNDTDIAPRPGWLLQALTPQAFPAPPPLTVSEAHLGSYVRAAVEYECRAVIDALPGTRNITLFSAARRLGQLVGACALRGDDAHSALLSAASCHVGIHHFTEREAAATIASGMAYGRRRPRHLTGAHDV